MLGQRSALIGGLISGQVLDLFRSFCHSVKTLFHRYLLTGLSKDDRNGVPVDLGQVVGFFLPTARPLRIEYSGAVWLTTAIPSAPPAPGV